MLKFSSNANSILSSSPCSQPGIQLNHLWWAWSTLPSMPSANGFQRASARILPCGNKSGDNANLPCIWLGINRKGSRAELRLWEQGWTVVRVNAGCMGCVKPSTSLKEENKIIFKISHEAKNLYKRLAKTPVQALPKAWHISKGFFSKGFAVGVPIAEDSCKPNPCRLDIKTLQGKKKKKKYDFRLHVAHLHVPSNVQNPVKQNGLPFVTTYTALLLASLSNSPLPSITLSVFCSVGQTKYCLGWKKQSTNIQRRREGRKTTRSLWRYVIRACPTETWQVQPCLV